MPPGWAATRALVLAGAPPCGLALGGCTGLGTEVHHPEPGNESWLMPACSACHGQVTQRQAAAGRAANRP